MGRVTHFVLHGHLAASSCNRHLAANHRLPWSVWAPTFGFLRRMNPGSDPCVLCDAGAAAEPGRVRDGAEGRGDVEERRRRRGYLNAVSSGTASWSFVV